MRSKGPAQVFFIVTLLLTDALMAALAFLLAYHVRLWIPWPNEAQNMGRITDYSGIVLAHVFSVLAVFIFSRMYRLARVPSRVD